MTKSVLGAATIIVAAFHSATGGQGRSVSPQAGETQEHRDTDASPDERECLNHSNSLRESLTGTNERDRDANGKEQC